MVNNPKKSYEGEACFKELVEGITNTQWQLQASQRIAHVGSWQMVMKTAHDVMPGTHLWSDETFRLFGYEPGEVEPNQALFFHHVHPDDAAFVAQGLQQSVDTCSSFDLEHRIIRKDGTEAILHERGECEPYAACPQYVKIFGTVQDITARREAEKNEAILKSIFDNTPLAYILLDSNLKVVSFNSLAYLHDITLLGYTLEVGKSILDYTVPERREMVSQLYPDVVKGKQYKYEHCFTKTDGTDLWCEINLFPILLDKTKDMGMALSFEDITEKKKSDDALKASQAKYSSFFKNSMDALLLTEKDGNILEVNPAACELFGMTEAEICAAGRFGLVDMEHPNVIPLLETRQRTGQARGEISFIRKDGSRFPGILTSSVYIDTNGKERTSMIVHDITERKAAEEALAYKNKELHNLMDHLSNVREEERSAIAREIHDELGQQLSTLKMGVHQVNNKLLAHNLSDNTISALLGEIDEAIKSVRRIASNLRPIILDYEGLSEALKWYASDFQKLHGIACDLKVDLPMEIENKKLSITLFRIFQETFTNIVRHANATAVTVDMNLVDGNIVLTISDNGVGIDLDALRSKRTFGIISMKERVAMVGGSYSINSMPDGGTITKVIVPFTFANACPDAFEGRA
jgi:PAS domain S-box-containing protein